MKVYNFFFCLFIKSEFSADIYLCISGKRLQLK